MKARPAKSRALIALALTGATLVPALAASSAGADPVAAHGLGALLPRTTVRPISQAALSRSLLGSASARLPASVDVSLYDPPVGNQGSVGSCVAWTIAHSMMGWYANRAGVASNFAPMYMYSQVNVGRTTGTDGGAYPIDGFQLVLEQGNDVEGNYTQGDYDWWDQPTAQERVSADAHRVFSGFQTLFASNSGVGAAGQQAIETALASGVPVAISLPVRPGFDNLSPTNTLDTDTTGAIRGNHEVMAVGYDSTGLRIENQWGTGWGSNGYGKLSWAVVQHDVYEAEIAEQAPSAFYVDAANGNTITNWRWNPYSGYQQTFLGGHSVAAGTSPSTVTLNGVTHVFFVDATNHDTLTDWSYTATGGWRQTFLYGHTVAPGTSPSAMVSHGAVNVAYVDATNGDTITDWTLSSSAGWQQTFFYGHRVATGTSPSAVDVNGTPHVFYVDATDLNTITDWAWNSTTGWQQTFFYGHRVATGTSPSAINANGTPHVFYVDATDLNTMTEWSWNSTTGWQQTFLYGHTVASGSSPAAVYTNGTPRAYFADATNGGTISAWSSNTGVGWQQAFLYGDSVVAGSSPTVGVVNGGSQVYFADANDNGDVTNWAWNPVSGWVQTPLYGHPVATGSSPAN